MAHLLHHSGVKPGRRRQFLFHFEGAEPLGDLLHTSHFPAARLTTAQVRLDIPQSRRLQRAGQVLLKAFHHYPVHKFLPCNTRTTTPQLTLDASLSATWPARFRGSATLPPDRSAHSAGHQAGSPIQALRRFHQLLPRPKQFHFDGILVHPGLSRQLFHRKPFHFLHCQQHTLLFGNPSKEFDNIIPARQGGIHGNLPIHRRLGILHPPHLVFAHVAFVDQLAHFALAQIVETLVNCDFVDPGDQRAAEIEALDGKVDLRKYLLCNVFHVITLANDAVANGEHLALVALHNFAKRRLIAGLRTLH